MATPSPWPSAYDTELVYAVNRGASSTTSNWPPQSWVSLNNHERLHEVLGLTATTLGAPLGHNTLNADRRTPRSFALANRRPDHPNIQTVKTTDTLPMAGACTAVALRVRASAIAALTSVAVRVDIRSSMQLPLLSS
jgi:hypothetical protein